MFILSGAGGNPPLCFNSSCRYLCSPFPTGRRRIFLHLGAGEGITPQLAHGRRPALTLTIHHELQQNSLSSAIL